MNITREKLTDLEYLVKVQIEQNDYLDTVKKTLKDYRRRANIPGFRVGMAPMSLVERMYKESVVSEVVQNLLNENLFKYIGDEKLEILGMPMSDDEKTGTIKFSNQTDFDFYFNIAVSPEFNIDWEKVDVAYNQIKITAKDIDNEVASVAERYGKYEAPETVGEKDTIYGNLVELDKNDEPKTDGVNSFAMLSLANLKDAEMLPLFVGKKVDDKITFNLFKAFTASEIERILQIDSAAAKKFKSDVEVTISGISRITPHEIDEELFLRSTNDPTIKDVESFRKYIQKKIEEANNRQSDYLFIRQAREKLVSLFDAPLPEAFLKRWFSSRGEAENIEEKWETEYVPSLKWELIEQKIENIRQLRPTGNDMTEHIKGVLRRNDPTTFNGDEESERRLQETAISIASSQENVRYIEDLLYSKNLAAVLKEKINPTVNKVSAKEFSERAAE